MDTFNELLSMSRPLNHNLIEYQRTQHHCCNHDHNLSQIQSEESHACQPEDSNSQLETVS